MLNRLIRILKTFLKLGREGEKCPRCDIATLQRIKSRTFLGTVETAGGPEASASISFKGCSRDEYLVINEIKCPNCSYVSFHDRRHFLRPTRANKL